MVLEISKSYDFLNSKIKHNATICISFLLSLDLLLKYLFCYYFSTTNCILNTGSAWSLFSNFQYYVLFIGVIGIVIALLLLIKKQLIINEIGSISFVLLLSGILGNSLNRLFSQGVYDMFSITFLPIFGVFNLADIFISIGVLLFISKEISQVITQSKHFHN